MIVLCWIAYSKNDHNFPVESLDRLRDEVGFSLEGQSINTRSQVMTFQQQICGATIGIGDAFANLLPDATATFQFKRDRDATGRPPTRGIEHMGGDGTHWLSSFSNLSREIFRCSSAATRNSVVGSFDKRLFKLASISFEVFPVAQTMKMKPKRSSYS